MNEEWKPIQTAPYKTPIIVTDGDTVIVAERWLYCDNIDGLGPVGFDGYEWEWDVDWKDLTHWMPVPVPPKVENK
jgi:hypothetical protein